MAGFMFFKDQKCPGCGTKGEKWNDEEEIFVCPCCETVFSEFGLVKMGSEPDFGFN